MEKKHNSEKGSISIIESALMIFLIGSACIIATSAFQSATSRWATIDCQETNSVDLTDAWTPSECPLPVLP